MIVRDQLHGLMTREGLVKSGILMELSPLADGEAPLLGGGALLTSIDNQPLPLNLLAVNAELIVMTLQHRVTAFSLPHLKTWTLLVLW